MQHAGQELQPEAAASTGRGDAAPDDAALVSKACFSSILLCQGCKGDIYPHGDMPTKMPDYPNLCRKNVMLVVCIC